MGRLVLDVCKSIPYGVLFFVPSYALLNKLLNRWSMTKQDVEIRKYKTIFSETKVAKNFDTLLKDYYNCIDDSNGDDVHNGGLLLAVYRGRASEGLDFSDNYGRAVIACGNY
jgi:Fanconi anemia group J protein